MNRYIKLFWDSFKNTKLYKWCESFYGWIIHILFKGKWMPKVLSFGGVHFILLALLFCQAIYWWCYLEENNVTSFNQIIYRFYGDTLKNYRINYLYFEKDMRRRPSNIFNVNDINYKYGFIKNNKKEREDTILLNYKDHDWKSNLVSKVRNLTCNSIKDTLSRRRFNALDTIHKIIYKTQYISNHERYYYDISTTDDSTHTFRRVTHAQDHLIEWENEIPCFSFWIGFILDNCNELNDSSVIRLKFNDFEKDVSTEGYKKPLLVEKVLPKPTTWDLKKIEYKGEELKAVLKQGGIYISGLDPEKKEIVEKKNIRTTVLLGTILAFMLDIVVQLVLKWRRLKGYNNFSNNSSK